MHRTFCISLEKCCMVYNHILHSSVMFLTRKWGSFLINLTPTNFLLDLVQKCAQSKWWYVMQKGVTCILNKHPPTWQVGGKNVNGLTSM